MPTVINEIEARVLGSLVEKQLTTPEYYPLTLNALTAACNQKSNRDPVMSLGETEILAAIDSLRDKNLVYLYYGSSSRAVKYKHMLPKVLELDEPAVAVMTLLLLRGAQTVGELRGRSDRLFEFGSLPEVQETLDTLADRDEPLVVRLERQPGQKESRYAHLLSGPAEPTPVVREQVQTSAAVSGNKIEDLEKEIARLSDEVSELRSQFNEFQKQFE
ncbi:MAG TPA: YceH family protein [Pyrinomonadaceae bacterium]|nr:YceH family protein [Pyrinomonadaceae bacterium]HMP64741.1 YceH family protein [Pyrinomonadaceae bacterium]